MSNLHTTLGWLRKSMTLLVILWVFGYIFTNLPPDVIRPLCVYPLFSHTSRCRLKEPKTFYADFPEMMGIQSRTFEHLLDESIGGSSLAIEIKNAEMSMRELVSLVKISDLTSKDLLASSMSEFVKDAKRTGVGLQDLTAKIHGSVDDILAINEYAMRSIEAAKGEPEESLPWPFMGMAKSSVEVARRSFDHVFLTLSTSIDDLVAEAQRSLNDLDNLEERLNTMNDIVTREDKSLSKKHKDLLASIWYKVGRGKVEKEQFEEDLAVLKNVGTYRKRAVDYVMNAMNELGKIKADMKVLRGKVRSPAITRGIPMEVQLESIRSGVMKLKQKSINAREQEQVAYKNFKARKNS
ncbi:hypothetical protein BD410DRAFT_732886 [Rickenella mellea]|uniref:Uncharacterized protein n=1 Tax=Rickenella mellea TaxID=50990 RepID=A0A4Y7PIV4_9AGAM|nr:hypothetical protein BD410DRAFT_732886 [Rickenella mellea]